MVRCGNNNKVACATFHGFASHDSYVIATRLCTSRLRASPHFLSEHYDVPSLRYTTQARQFDGAYAISATKHLVTEAPVYVHFVQLLFTIETITYSRVCMFDVRLLKKRCRRYSRFKASMTIFGFQQLVKSCHSAFHEKTKAAKPNQPCKPTTCWAGVLMCDKNPAGPKTEEDYLWSSVTMFVVLNELSLNFSSQILTGNRG